MPVTVTWTGLDELRESLRRVPHDLVAEAGHIVEAAANGAYTDAKANYPRVSGNLSDHLSLTELFTLGPFGVGYLLKNTAKHAWIFENGTQGRHRYTTSGAHRGVMPPSHAFMRAVLPAKRLMYAHLRALLERKGFVIAPGGGRRAVDSGDIDTALLQKLGNDPELLSYAVNGVYMDEAPPKTTRFVIVSLIDAFDEAVFGGRAIEDALYLVEYRELKPPTGVGHAKAAAARIDALLDDGTLTLPAGYTLMAVFRESRTRITEVDEAEESIRWYRRGGRYRVQVSLDLVHAG